jgi:hypothetical protein
VPEPGRTSRRLAALGSAGFGAGALLIAVVTSLSTLGQPWVDRSRLLLPLVFAALLISGSVSLAGSTAWGLARSRHFQKRGAHRPTTWWLTMASPHEPDPALTSHDDPRIVAYARALRAFYRHQWIASAPLRWLLRASIGWLCALLTFRFGRDSALSTLAHALQTTSVAYDERPILDWLDQQGWGPAPHVSYVWLGARRTVLGRAAGVPVAVSVVERLGSDDSPDVRRTDLFFAGRLGPHVCPADLQARAASHGYSASLTPWGAVLSRDDVSPPKLTPAIVTELARAFIPSSEIPIAATSATHAPTTPSP